MLPARKAGLLSALNRVQRCKPTLPLKLKDVSRSPPWSKERIAAFDTLMREFKRFSQSYEETLCPPQVIMFLRFWLRFDEKKQRWTSDALAAGRATGTTLLNRTSLTIQTSQQQSVPAR